MIPGFIITWLTFPGVIIHEWAHQLFCHWTGTKIHQVCYFRFGNPAGFVIHEIPTNVWKHILIGIGPLFINSGMGLVIGLLIYPLESKEIIFLPLIWLAVSIAMHSFPSTGDAKAIWKAVWSQKAPLSAKWIGSPLVVLIYAGAIGSAFWLDFFYGAFIAYGIPKFLGI